MERNWPLLTAEPAGIPRLTVRFRQVSKPRAGLLKTPTESRCLTEHRRLLIFLMSVALGRSPDFSLFKFILTRSTCFR